MPVLRRPRQEHKGWALTVSFPQSNKGYTQLYPAQNQESLLALPEHPFPIFRYEAVTVNKCGLATIDTNKYGLAPALAGWTV